MPEPELPRIPGYVVQNVLARGGMAVVYSALELASRRPVALKRILPDVAEDPEFLDRFRHEVRIHSQLAHPNVLALHGYGTGPDFYLAMELVEGGSLRDLVNRAGKLPPELACFAAAEVLRGLSCAHDRGIVHRDMKPQNVLVTRHGVLKVADFGISKTSQMTRLTQTGQVVGTPAYMSPEQAMAHPLDPRSDVFSVGVMLYEMLTGVNPFLTDNPATTLRMIVDREPPSLFTVDPSIPIECERVVERMLEKDPATRTASAALAARALDERVAAMGLAAPLEAFRQHLADPRKALRERNERLSRGHLATARSLRSEGSSVEVVLWEAFLATVLDRSSTEARNLVTALTAETGYTLDGSSARSRTLELEARAAEEPDDPNVLLSAAKAAKMDRDFVRTMRFFFRLRSLGLDDPYLLGQIASLVGKPGARPPAAGPPPVRPAASAAAPRPATRAAPPEGPQTRRTPPAAAGLPLPLPPPVASPRPAPRSSPPDPHATRRLAGGPKPASPPRPLSRAAVVAAAVATGAAVYALVRLLLS